MFRKISFFAIFAAFAIATLAVNSFAQTAPVSGTVTLKKADGTSVPAAGITVDAYRTDIDKGKMPSGKTNKRGEFSFIGFVLGQTYALAVSGPGIHPDVHPNIKAGQEGLTIEVVEGDGKQFTEEEVRAAIKAGTGQASADLTPEQRKAQEKAQADYQKQVDEVKAKNEKMQQGDAVARKASEEGNAALHANNFDLAISKYDEGIAAVPDFVGSTPILLDGKLMALKQRGYGFYKEGVTSPDASVKLAKYELAKKDYNDALAAYAQAIEVIKNAPAATDPNDQKKREALKLGLMKDAMEIHRLMAVGGVDITRSADAGVIYTEYLAVETDPAKKLAAQITIGDIYRLAGQPEKAIAAYKVVMETSPESPDALAGLGLSLFDAGVTASNKAQMQEGLNYMQKFVDTAPDTHPLKASVKEAVDYLKTNEKLAPQKVAPKKKGA